jgi:hypothetical protein
VDVYSLAATLFRLVTGQVPYPVPLHSDGRVDEAELVRQIEQGLPDPDPRCAGLPAPLEQVIRSGLTPFPELRPDLRTFLSRLRSTLNQLLADALPRPPTPGPIPVNLRLVVSRQSGSGVYEPVATTRPGPDRTTRDMKKVPRPPEQAPLRTGDRIRIEVQADRDGFLTVFDVGPTGNLNVLYPEELPGGGESAALVKANQPLHISEVEMVPPAGRERLFAVWSLFPLPLRREDLLSLTRQQETSGSSSYRATRDMKRVHDAIQTLAPGAWHVDVLELDHRP